MPDQGHIETERILRETEADVRRVYRQAVDETQKKLEDYLRRFEVKDNVKREQLARGEITAKEYADWKKGQILIGQRWEEMRDTLAQDLHNSNTIARSIVQGHIPEAYAVNHNYATFQIEKGSMLDTSYTLYDRQTVERIIRDQPELLPPPGKDLQKRIAANKDIAWQRGQIQSVTLQSILQGESIPKMARRIAREMGETNYESAVRYARTAITGAQNAGRVDAYKRAEEMGIDLEQEWLATLDKRTRDAHRHLDGKHVKVGDPFVVDGHEIRFPGDPAAPGYLIWNCRCTLVPRVKGVDQSDAPRNSKLGDMTYDEWKGRLEQKELSAEARHADMSSRQFTRFTDDMQAVKYSIDNWSSWYNGLSENEKQSLSEYGYGSNYINGNLRGKKGSVFENSKVENQIRNIDSAISKGTIPDNIIAYRGIGKNYLGVDLSNEDAVKRAIGSTITDPGYLSTSIRSHVAEDYSRGTILEIKVPKGMHAAYVDMTTNTVNELIEFTEEGDPGNIEYLLERGGSLHLTDYDWFTDDRGRKHLRVFAEYTRI